jgi:hypothetical protein
MLILSATSLLTSRQHCRKNIFGQCHYLAFSAHKQCTYIKSVIHNSLLCFPQKTLCPGFEPGSSVPEADVMSTAPLLQRAVFKTSIGAYLRIGANSAKCHHCVGASSLCRRKNPFKKLAQDIIATNMLGRTQNCIHTCKCKVCMDN